MWQGRLKHKPHVIKSNSVSLLISLSIESNRHSRDGKAKLGPIDVNLNISLNEPTQCRVSFMQLSRSPFPGWGRGHSDVRTKSSSHRPLPWPQWHGPRDPDPTLALCSRILQTWDTWQLDSLVRLSTLFPTSTVQCSCRRIGWIKIRSRSRPLAFICQFISLRLEIHLLVSKLSTYSQLISELKADNKFYQTLLSC